MCAGTTYIYIYIYIQFFLLFCGFPSILDTVSSLHHIIEGERGSTYHIGGNLQIMPLILWEEMDAPYCERTKVRSLRE